MKRWIWSCDFCGALIPKERIDRHADSHPAERVDFKSLKRIRRLRSKHGL